MTPWYSGSHSTVGAVLEDRVHEVRDVPVVLPDSPLVVRERHVDGAVLEHEGIEGGGGLVGGDHDFELVLEVVLRPLRGLVAGARRGELVQKRHVGSLAQMVGVQDQKLA